MGRYTYRVRIQTASGMTAAVSRHYLWVYGSVTLATLMGGNYSDFYQDADSEQIGNGLYSYVFHAYVSSPATVIRINGTTCRWLDISAASGGGELVLQAVQSAADAVSAQGPAQTVVVLHVGVSSADVQVSVGATSGQWDVAGNGSASCWTASGHQ
jgi:hypothetical protein